MHIDPANYKPFAPNGWRGIHQGAAIVFFAYIGFDAISTAAEETKNPQRNMPIGILGGLAICTRHLRRSSASSRPGWCRISSCKAADPLARALEVAGLPTASWIVAFGAVVSLTAVLLVFQYGQPRIFFAMARDGLLPAWASRDPSRSTGRRTSRRSSPASSWRSAAWSPTRTRSTTSRTSARCRAFAIVCVGVLVLRYTDPDRPRPFRVPFVWPVVSLVGAAACVYVDDRACRRTAWERFGIWLALGLAALFRLRLPPQPAPRPLNGPSCGDRELGPSSSTGSGLVQSALFGLSPESSR